MEGLERLPELSRGGTAAKHSGCCFWALHSRFKLRPASRALRVSQPALCSAFRFGASPPCARRLNLPMLYCCPERVRGLRCA